MPVSLIPAGVPNLHPLVVHFPIALALTALLMRVILVIRPRLPRLEWAASALTLLATIGGGVAWLAGRQAAQGMGTISMAAEEQLSRHADLAGITVLLLAAASLMAIIHNLKRGSEHGPSRRSALAACGVLLLAAGFVAVTADVGGSLVYRYGLGVQRETRDRSDRADPAGPQEVIQPGSAVIDWPAQDQEAVAYAVAGAGLILLPATYDDVAVTAVVDPAGFDGSLAVVHHAASPDQWEGFALTANNRAQLLRRGPGQESVLKSTAVLFPRERTTLLVTASGGHFKGLVDGDLLLHGHGSSGAEGRAGLYYNGQGTFIVYALEAETAAGHAHE